MSDFHVLLIYPNQRAESLVPPSIAMFSRLLKDHGYEVDLFDSSFYDLDADDYIAQMDSSGSGQGDGIEVVKSKGDAKSLIQNCLVRPYESKADSLRKHEGAVEVLMRKVEGFQPHLIAVTSTESTVLLAMQLLKAVRHHRIPTILGGVFATFAPERAIDFPEVDMICVGEGEVALLDLCERMRAGESYDDVTNLWIKKQSGILSAIPSPNRWTWTNCLRWISRYLKRVGITAPCTESSIVCCPWRLIVDVPTLAAIVIPLPRMPFTRSRQEASISASGPWRRCERISSISAMF